MRFILICCWCLVTTGLVQAGDFLLKRADGEPLRGQLEAIAANGQITLDGQIVAADEVVALQALGHAVPPRSTQPQLQFANGDCITGELLTVQSDGMHFQPHWTSEAAPRVDPPAAITIPLSVGGVVWIVPPQSPLARDERWQAIVSDPRRRDELWLRNRDRLTGTLLRYDRKADLLEYDRDGTTTNVEASRVAAIAWNTTLTRTRKPTTRYATLTLANGTRLTVSKWSITGKLLNVTPIYGGELRLPLAELVRLTVFNGRAVYLSDLKPSKYEEQPYLALRWGYSNDAAWHEPLSLTLPEVGPSIADKGVAQMPSSTLRYSLGGRYQRFETTVGLQSGSRGDALITVLLDDKPVSLPDGNRLRRGVVQDLQIDTTGAKELTLKVDWGARGPVQDRIIWGDARLIRRK